MTINDKHIFMCLIAIHMLKWLFKGWVHILLVLFVFRVVRVFHIFWIQVLYQYLWFTYIFLCLLSCLFYFFTSVFLKAKLQLLINIKSNLSFFSLGIMLLMPLNLKFLCISQDYKDFLLCFILLGVIFKDLLWVKFVVDKVKI